MSNETVLDGFVLLGKGVVEGYRGVDRPRFEPSLIDSEIMNMETPADEPRIWKFYPPGWRQSAYRLFEENMVDVDKEDVFLLNNLQIAKKVAELIAPHIGAYEIVRCLIGHPQRSTFINESVAATNIGYDIAYLGGDYYSAILNGLFVNPHVDLVEIYRAELNRFGLFANSQVALEYLSDFKKKVVTEQSADFYLYKLVIAFGAL